MEFYFHSEIVPLQDLAINSNLLILRPRQFFLEIDNLFDLHQKPVVNFCEVENLLDGKAGVYGQIETYPNKSICGAGESDFNFSRSCARRGWRTLPSGVSSDSSRLPRICLARSSTSFGT